VNTREQIKDKYWLQFLASVLDAKLDGNDNIETLFWYWFYNFEYKAGTTLTDYL